MPLVSGASRLESTFVQQFSNTNICRSSQLKSYMANSVVIGHVVVRVSQMALECGVSGTLFNRRVMWTMSGATSGD